MSSYYELQRQELSFSGLTEENRLFLINTLVSTLMVCLRGEKITILLNKNSWEVSGGEHQELIEIMCFFKSVASQ